MKYWFKIKGFKIKAAVKQFINKIELAKTPTIYFFLTMLFVITLRNFLEFFSDNEEILASNLVHYYVYYIAFGISLIILFHIITKEPITRITKIISLGYIVVLLAPLLDLIISKGKGYNMSYLMPGHHDALLERFLTFFGNTGEFGVTIGQRIEIAIILLCCFVYIYIKTENKIKSVFGTIACYCLFFIYAIMPFLAKWFLALFKIAGSNGINYEYSNTLMLNFYLLILFVEIICLAYLWDKRKLTEIAKDLRISRVIYYLLLFVLGIVIGSKTAAFHLTERMLFSIIFIVISFLFACSFSIITNNIADTHIDKISNKNRPHVSQKSAFTLTENTLKEYRSAAWLFLFLAMAYAAAAGQEAWFMITLFTGNYFLYSMPPLRLKRITLLSKMFIGINSLAMILLGYVLVTGSILSFPLAIALFALIGITAVANFIDIKDYKGDKHEGIKTLPVVLGLRTSKLVIGIMFLIVNMSAYFLIKDIKALPFLAGFGLIELYLVTRQKYDELPVFLALLSSIVLLIAYLLF